MIPLELILSEIPEKWKITARFARGIPPSGSPPDGGTKSAKFHSLMEKILRAPLKKDEKKFCGLCFPVDAGTSRFPP